VYEVRTVYGKEDIAGLAGAYSYTQRPTRAVGKALRKVSLVLGTLMMAMAVIAVVGAAFLLQGLPHERRGEFLLAVVVGTLIWFLLGLRFFLKSGAPLGGAWAWRSYRQKGEELRYRFEPCRFVLERPHARCEYDYRAILQIVENEGCFYLFDTPQTAFILPKRDFQQGTPDEFRDFIQRVTEKAVIDMK